MEREAAKRNSMLRQSLSFSSFQFLVVSQIDWYNVPVHSLQSLLVSTLTFWCSLLENWCGISTVKLHQSKQIIPVCLIRSMNVMSESVYWDVVFINPLTFWQGNTSGVCFNCEYYFQRLLAESHDFRSTGKLACMSMFIQSKAWMFFRYDDFVTYVL